MKVVFVEEVEGSGQIGEVKVVKDGYARNFLLPRGLAVPATAPNLQRADKLARADVIRQDKLDASGQSLAKRIDGQRVTLTARVGEQGRLFGSITAIDIAGALSALAGEEVDHRQVLLGQAIKTIGREEVRVRLTRNVFATVTVQVESEAGEAGPSFDDAVAAAEAEEATDVAEEDAVEAQGESPAETEA